MYILILMPSYWQRNGFVDSYLLRQYRYQIIEQTTDLCASCEYLNLRWRQCTKLSIESLAYQNVSLAKGDRQIQ